MSQAWQPIFLVVFGALNEPLALCMVAHFKVYVLNNISLISWFYLLPKVSLLFFCFVLWYFIDTVLTFSFQYSSQIVGKNKYVL